MGLFKLIVIILAVAFIAGAIKGFLARRQKNKRISNQNDSVAEELYKLHELKSRGILSEEEYQKQKNKLLNK